MSRNKRSKLMNMLFHLVVTIYSVVFAFLIRFSCKRQTNLKSMFDALSVNLC
jgi:preprotein translocase subunit YajC